MSRSWHEQATLDRDKLMADRLPTPTARSRSSKKGRRGVNPGEILLVEDNPRELELMLEVLKRSEFARHVQIAHDGAEALELLFPTDERADGEERPVPRLVVLDLKLPKVDGLQVLRRLRSNPRTRTIPIVILTGSSLEHDILNSYELGVNSYLVKPVDYDAFAVLLQQVGTYWLLVNQPPSK
jgi:two-component system, response regulator